VTEETGFTELLRIVPLECGRIFTGKDGRPWRVRTFGVEVPRVSPPRLGAEHTHYRWCRPAEALAQLFWPDNREALRHLGMLERF
jgi:hypothetical protein